MGVYKEWRRYINGSTVGDIARKFIDMSKQIDEMTQRRNYWWERARYAERRLKDIDPDFVPYGEKLVERKVQK